MSSPSPIPHRTLRRTTACALVAGSLCLLPSIAQAAPASQAARSRPAAAVVNASPSVLDSLWSLLVNLFAADDHHHHDHGGGPNTDEGPGMCPHG